MLFALVLPVSLASASLISIRTVDDIWGDVNISKAAYEVYNSISSPTCNATSYCVEFATKSVPRCTALQGTAGCWCTLHDPLHYCALCMSNPSDNTTTPDQTQLATSAHQAYHKGCGAWQAYINATATGGLSSSAVPTPSASAAAASTTPASSSKSNTGAIVGGVVGGVAGLILLAALIFFLFRRKNKSTPAGAAQEAPPALHPKASEAFSSGGGFNASSPPYIDPQHTARSDLSRGKSENFHGTPPPAFMPNRPLNYDTSILDNGYKQQPELMQ